RDAAHREVEPAGAQVGDQIAPTNGDDLDAPAAFAGVKSRHCEVEALECPPARDRERWVVTGRPDPQHRRTRVPRDAAPRREDEYRKPRAAVDANYERSVMGSRCTRTWSP